MSSAARALDAGAPSRSSDPTGSASRTTKASESGAAGRPLNLWWRYRDSDLTIDQSLYLKLPCAEERLVVRDRNGELKPLPEDASGRDFLVEGKTVLRLGQLAQVIVDWLTLPMRRFYVRSPSGRFLELAEADASRRDALIRRLDSFLDDGAGPYRILAVALRPSGEERG